MAKKKDWKYFGMIVPACMFLYSHAQSPEIPLRPDSTHISAHTAGSSAASTPAPLIIGQISIAGNHKTKNYIVERELSFKRGDTITLSELVKSFQLAHD